MSHHWSDLPTDEINPCPDTPMSHHWSDLPTDEINPCPDTEHHTGHPTGYYDDRGHPITEEHWLATARPPHASEQAMPPGPVTGFLVGPLDATDQHLVDAVTADLLNSDAMTANDSETLHPDHYLVDAENVAYLVQTVLTLAAYAVADAAVNGHLPEKGRR